jgi:hypothetical protein
MGNYRRVPTRWPRVRTMTDDSVCISGRCRTARRHAVLSALCRLLIRAMAFVLIAAAFIALPVALMEDCDVPRWVLEPFRMLIDLRRGFRSTLLDIWPQVQQVFYDHPEASIDWHMGAAGMILNITAGGVTPVLTWMVEWLPFMRRRFKIVITPAMVVVQGWLFTRRFDRNAGAPVVFRMIDMRQNVNPAQQRGALTLLMPGVRSVPGMVEVHQGIHRVPILYAMNSGEGEAIVARCMDALARTNPHTAMDPI